MCLPSAGAEIKGPGSSGNEQAANWRTAKIRKKQGVRVAMAETHQSCECRRREMMLNYKNGEKTHIAIVSCCSLSI